jgi:hypothetical protein
MSEPIPNDPEVIEGIGDADQDPDWEPDDEYETWENEGGQS